MLKLIEEVLITSGAFGLISIMSLTAVILALLVLLKQ